MVDEELITRIEDQLNVSRATAILVEIEIVRQRANIIQKIFYEFEHDISPDELSPDVLKKYDKLREKYIK